MTQASIVSGVASKSCGVWLIDDTASWNRRSLLMCRGMTACICGHLSRSIACMPSCGLACCRWT
jgi:hypothetical protein